jgi:hypothetical protein
MKIDASLVQSLNMQRHVNKHNANKTPDAGEVNDNGKSLGNMENIRIENVDKVTFDEGNPITQDILASLRSQLDPSLRLEPTAPVTDVPVGNAYIIFMPSKDSEENKASWNFFLNQHERFSNWYKECLSNGSISQEEYEKGMDKINQDYDEYFWTYNIASSLLSLDATSNPRFSQSPLAADFALFEEHLADIKARYERGVFGEGEDVLAVRMEAWSKSFDGFAAGTAKYVEIMLKRFTAGGVFEAQVGNQDAVALLNDVLTMYKTAKEHILAGGAAADLTEESLGAKYLTVNDIEYLCSDEAKSLVGGVTKNFEAYSRLDLEATSRIQGNYEKYFTNMKLAVQSADIGAALKAAILRRASYGLLYKWV